jgi:hypothetical protein
MRTMSNPYQSPEGDVSGAQQPRRGWKANCLGGLKAAGAGMLSGGAFYGAKQLFAVTPAWVDLGLVLSLVTFYVGLLIAIVAGTGWLMTRLLRR